MKRKDKTWVKVGDAYKNKKAKKKKEKKGEHSRQFKVGVKFRG